MLKHRVSNAGMISNSGVNAKAGVSPIKAVGKNLNASGQGTYASGQSTTICGLSTNPGGLGSRTDVINENDGVIDATYDVTNARHEASTSNDSSPSKSHSGLKSSTSIVTTENDGLHSNTEVTETNAGVNDNCDVVNRSSVLSRQSSFLKSHAGLQALAGVLTSNAGLMRQASLTSHTISEFNGVMDSPEHTLKDKREVFSDSELCSVENRLVHSSSVDTDDGGTMSNDEGVRRINEKYESVGRLSRCSSVKSPTFKDIYAALPESLSHNNFQEGVTEQDLLQVDTFYRSHKTEVFLCGCLANLYFGSLRSSISNHPWKFSCTGIPLMVLDSGEHVRARRLHLVVAEKGTGFTLWRDVISTLTQYRAPNPNFHTLHVSTDHTKLAGLSFDDTKAAADFIAHIHKFTSDPSDDLLKIGKIKKKKSIREKKRKIKLPKKSEISQPCCFVHVTKLNSEQVTEEELEVDKGGVVSKPFNFEHKTAHRGSVDQSTSGDLSNSMENKLMLTSSESMSSSMSGGK